MKDKQMTEDQIIKVFEDYNSGKSGLDLFEKYGVHGINIFELKQKYKDLKMDVLKEIIALNEENCQLKAMYADLSMQFRKMKDLLKEDF